MLVILENILKINFMNILVTGCAGFIGFHLSLKFLKKNLLIIGVDNLNNYYDTKIKKERLKILKEYKNFIFIKGDLKNKSILGKIRNLKNINFIYHFAGQAGVRYSIKQPVEYIKDNIISYINLLEAFKFSNNLKAIFYASSSSIYGNQFNKSSNLNTVRPISVYAVSKISMELLSQVYLSLYKVKSIGLRFFTVYGPWGRPDMAYFKFCNLYRKKKKIEVYNKGNHYRSFTYIDDVINNILLIKKKVNKIDLLKKNVFNIGNPKMISLKKLIIQLEKNLDIKFQKSFKNKQMGDVLNTRSNNKFEQKIFKFKFETDFEKGVKKFTDWFSAYYEKK